MSHHLDELPPVSFNSIDVSCLLARIEKLSADITALKQGMNVQVKVSTDLCSASGDLHRRLTAVEQCGPGKATVTQAPQASNVSAAIEEDTESASDAPAQWLPGGSGCMVESTAEEGASAAASADTWSTVAKRRGHRLAASTLERPKPRLNRPIQREKRSGIVGIDPESSIRTVRTKLVSVFATKFTPELDANTLSLYLQSKLGREVGCSKIESVQSRYSSFNCRV